MEKRKVKVIMLPTEDKTNIGINTDNDLIYSNHKLTTFHSNVIMQHLYITTDDEIKEDDWFYCYNTGLIYRVTKHSDLKRINKSECVKIIATTDNSLIIEYQLHSITNKETIINLPQIPQLFLKEYCEKKGIDEVLVDFNTVVENSYGETHVLTGKESKSYLKTCNTISSNPDISFDNTITIHPIKDSWTKEEVDNIILKSFESGRKLTTEGFEQEDWKDYHKLLKENI